MNPELALTENDELLIKVKLTDEQLKRIKAHYENKKYSGNLVVYRDGEIVIDIREVK